MKKMEFGILLIGLLFLILNSIYALDQEIKIENGIHVVYNPKNPPHSVDSPTKLVLEEELSIGDSKKGSNYIFEYIRTIRVDEDDNIYVLDQKASIVRVFDKNGNHIMNVGNKGQGPGEFLNPTAMHIISGKEIMIASMGRISFLKSIINMVIN